MAVLRKPEGCKGCPAYQTGVGFVPDEIVEGAEVTVMAQNPGKYECAGLRVLYKAGRDWACEPTPNAPLTGPTGLVLDKEFGPLAGLERGKYSLMNAQRCRWGETDEMRPLKEEEQRAAIVHCQRVHGRMPKSTKLVVAMGEYAMWATTCHGGKNDTVTDWRGYVLPYRPALESRPATVVEPFVWVPGPGTAIPVLVTFHLAFLNHAPWEYPTAQRDWSKVQALLKGTWPQPMPKIDPLPPTHWPVRSAFDTEFDPMDRLIRYSLAYHTPDGIKLHVVEAEDHSPVIVPENAVVIVQNYDADAVHMNNVLGGQRVKVRDTMLGHATLWPDLDHNLNYGGSMYALLNRWKHLAHLNPRVYAGGDAVGTLQWWDGLEHEFKRDPRSWKVYQTMMEPLWPIIFQARAKGARVNQAQVKATLEQMNREQADAVRRAQAAVGWPINLASPPQVADWLYRVEKLGRK